MLGSVATRSLLRRFVALLAGGLFSRDVGSRARRLSGRHHFAGHPLFARADIHFLIDANCCFDARQTYQRFFNGLEIIRCQVICAAIRVTGGYEQHHPSFRFALLSAGIGDCDSTRLLSA